MPEQKAYVPGVPSYYMPSATSGTTSGTTSGRATGSGTSSGSQTSGKPASSGSSGGKTTTQQEYVIDWKTGTGEGTSIIKAGSLEEAQKIAQQRYGSQSAYVITGGNSGQAYVSYGGSGTAITNVPQNTTGVGVEYLKQASSLVNPPPRQIHVPEGDPNIKETRQFNTPYGPITSKEMELLQNMSPYLNQYMHRGMMTTGITAFEQQTGITVQGKTAKEKGEYVGLLMQKYDYITRNPNQPFVYYDKEGNRHEGIAQIEARKDEKGNTTLVYSALSQQASPNTINFSLGLDNGSYETKGQTFIDAMNNLFSINPTANITSINTAPDTTKTTQEPQTTIPPTQQEKKPTRALVISPFGGEPQGYTLIAGKELEFYMKQTAQGNKVLLSNEQGEFVDITKLPRENEPTQYLFDPFSRTKTFINGPTITNIGVANDTQQNNNIPLSENVRIYTREGIIAQRGELEQERSEQPRMTIGPFNIATLQGPSQNEIRNTIPTNIMVDEQNQIIYYTIGNTTYEKKYNTYEERREIERNIATLQLKGLQSIYEKYGFAFEGSIQTDEQGKYYVSYKTSLSEKQQEYVKRQQEKFFDYAAGKVGEKILKTGLMHPDAGIFSFATTEIPYTITIGGTQEMFQTSIPTDYTKNMLINKYGARAFLSQETYELFKPVFSFPILGTIATGGLEATYKVGQLTSTVAFEQQYQNIPKAYEMTYGYGKERNIALERTVEAAVSTGIFTLDVAILSSTVPAVAKATAEAIRMTAAHAGKEIAEQGIIRGSLALTGQATKTTIKTAYEVMTFPIFTKSTEYAVRAGVGASELIGFNVAKTIPKGLVRVGGGALKVMEVVERGAYIGVPLYDVVKGGEQSDFTKGRIAGITQTGQFLTGAGTYGEQKSALHSFTIMNVPYYAIRVMSGPSKSMFASKLGDIAYMTLNAGAVSYLAYRNAVEINPETGKPYGIAYSMGKTSGELQFYDIYLESLTVDKGFEASRIAKRAVIGEQKLPLDTVQQKLALTAERTDFSIITKKRSYEGVILKGETTNVVKVKETSPRTTKEFQFETSEKAPIEEVFARTINPKSRNSLDIQQIKFEPSGAKPEAAKTQEVPVNIQKQYSLIVGKKGAKPINVKVEYTAHMDLDIAKLGAKTDIRADIKADTKADTRTDTKVDTKADIKSDIRPDVKTDKTKIDIRNIDIKTIDFGKIDVSKADTSKIDITKIDIKNPIDMKIDFPPIITAPPLFPPLRGGGSSDGEGFGLNIKQASQGHMASIFEAMRFAERTIRFK